MSETKMAESPFARTAAILGDEAMQRLHDARVAVFGVGGVGGYVVEALVRSGVGTVDVFDKDDVSITNLNRQIIALHSTVGEWKTDVAAKRVKDINPDIKVRTYNLFFLPETADEFDFDGVDYVTPNETEAEFFTGIRCEGMDIAQWREAAAKAMHDRGVKMLIITMGEHGAYYSGPDGAFMMPAFKIQPVDSTAAGDAFSGGFAVKVPFCF